MRIDKYTVKAQEALQEAQGLARRAGNPNMEPEHVLRALLQQQDGVLLPILAQGGRRREPHRPAVEEALEAAAQAPGERRERHPRASDC